MKTNHHHNKTETRFLRRLLLVVTVATTTVTIAPVLSFAKTLENFRLSAKVENLHSQLSSAADILGLASGASGMMCSQNFRIEQRETLKGPTGKNIEKVFQSSSDVSWSLLGTPQVNMALATNFENGQPQLAASVTETCSGNIKRPGICLDEIGNKYACIKDEFVNIPMTWKCTISGQDYPKNESTREFSCQPDPSTFLNILDPTQMITASLMSYVKNKKITLQMTHTGSQDIFEVINCPSSNVADLQKNLYTIFKFRGGVKALTGENDFEYHIDLDNQKDILIKPREDGLANFDVVYCHDVMQPVQLNVRVVEKDLLFNNWYAQKNPSVFDAAPYSKKQITLNRNGWFLKRDSLMEIEALNQPYSSHPAQ